MNNLSCMAPMGTVDDNEEKKERREQTKSLRPIKGQQGALPQLIGIKSTRKHKSKAPAEFDISTETATTSRTKRGQLHELSYELTRKGSPRIRVEDARRKIAGRHAESQRISPTR